KDETEEVAFTLVQQLGTLQINSTPAGAAVYLNGTATGDLTNATLADKPVGTYNVTVELEGYDPATEIVTLSKDETEDVSFTLVQQLGTLQINSTPAGASVYLNGTATGDLTNVTLADKPVGTYNVTVELEGYDPATEIVTLSKDETEDVSFTLVQQLGTLQINSTPAGASVYLNGTATGDLTNVTLADKPVGTYNVTVELDGYDPATEVVTLSKDETEEVAFTLVQQLGTLQINSTPAGAAVYLNGTATGEATNVTLADKPLGTYNVTVELNGYDPATEIVTLSKDETEEVSFTLVQQLGTLQINSTPAGASVYLNGTATGDLTNATLTDKPVGTYNVTVLKDGYDPATEIVTLSKDETEDVSFTLVQQLGTLQINSTPSGASVYLNGTATGDLTNATLADKPVGTYNVTVLKDGYDPATEIVTLSKDETEDVSFTLVQQLGTLQINSTPAGASVYLNGTATGDLTNATLADKPVGTYNVTVELNGYDPATEIVTLSKDETEDVSFTLVQQLGTLQINSTPSGAAVYLNGTATGDLTNATLADKPVGTYNVTVLKDGYDPATEIVTVTKDESEEVSFTLVQQLGTLQINSTPSGAAVYLNGTATGDLTNVTLADKPVGTYNVTVELEGYDPATEIVTLSKDETEDVSFTLVQQLGTLQINSTPAGASVYLNGTATGDLTNVTLADKPVGTYNVTVELDGYDPATEVVTLTKDETEEVAFTLVQQLGTLQINSTPAGASVYLNGTATGDLTNATLADKPVGTYNVTVELDGYDPATEVVTLSKDETEEVSFTLVQQLGTLQINSTPSGAAVYLNGTATGDLTNATLADKPVGTYNVTVELDGYDPATEVVTLSKDETEEVSFTLVQQLGTLQINSTPSGAAVYLNGTATGDLTNATLADKPVGTYNVTVELDGYDPATEVVTLSKDETEEVSFTLVQQLGTLQINSTPSGAAVYLNGTATGDLTNATLADKPVGTYNVTVELDGYDPATEVVTLSKDETEEVSFTLVQQL
ncbi:PEGA domain-containing protein, partial [Methanofollis fontis]